MATSVVQQGLERKSCHPDIQNPTVAACHFRVTQRPEIYHGKLGQYGDGSELARAYRHVNCLGFDSLYDPAGEKESER